MHARYYGASFDEVKIPDTRGSLALTARSGNIRVWVMGKVQSQNLRPFPHAH
jgi:hypothetical protein